MGNSTIQPSFTSGEFSPSMYGRVDFARYYTALKTCRNFIVRQFGGISNRPGTYYTAETKSSGVVRFIPFQFSSEQSYVLVFGNHTMRVVKDGGIVVYPVGHPSAGQIVEVVTPWLAADLPFLKFTQSADIMTICRQGYQPQQLSRTDHHLWTLSAFTTQNGPFDEVNIDDTLTVDSDDVSGNVTLTASDDLFVAGHVGILFYLEQSPDALTSRWEVEKAVTINDIRRAGANYYQALSTGTTGTVRPSVEEGVEHDGDPGVQWKYLHSGFGIARITAVNSATEAEATVLKRFPDQVVTSTASRTITNIVGNGDAPDQHLRVTSAAHGFVDGDVITISGVVGTTEANGTWTIDVIDANTYDILTVVFANAYTSGGVAAKSNTAVPAYKWAFGAWGNTNLYPQASHYHQNRQIFGGSYGDPQGIWMSTSGGYNDFEQHIPLLDDDGINLRLVTNEANEIRHFVELQKLIVFTSAGSFALQGSGENNAFLASSPPTPTSQQGRGCSHVRPIKTGSQCLYIQSKGNQIYNMGYSFADDAFVGGDLTMLASHLFNGYTIVDWAYQESPYSVVWAVRSDGKLLGLTYLPEQQIAGWHQHDTDGYVENVCCVTEGNEDVVYLCVRRTVNGATKRYIERMANRQFTAVEDAFFVDCGLTYDGVPATVFSGLDHLEGKTVSILADGAKHPQRVVSGGSVTLQSSASVVHIGLPYTSDMETLELNASGGNLLDKAKVVSHVRFMVEDTVALKAGPNAANLTMSKGRSTEPYGDPDSLKSGLVEIAIACSWSKNGRVFVRNEDPLPVTILAVMPDVTTGGK